MSDEIVLKTVGLTKVYRKLKKEVLALEGLCLSLQRGEVFGFLGPNGAGKSTTIKILTGQIRGFKGDARIFGCGVDNLRARSRMGYLPELPSFYEFLTGREYLSFVAKCFSSYQELCSKKIDDVLERVDLVSAADRQIRSYSKGMVQRLGIAQTLVHDPDLYIFDEPMSGLDPMGRALVKDIINELRSQGKTVFFSTHITADVEAVCDQLGVIVGGRLCALDRVDNILQSYMKTYQIQVVDKNGTVKEVLVPADQLQQQIESLWSQGMRIVQIDPKRQDLEAFFLNIVNKYS